MTDREEFDPQADRVLKQLLAYEESLVAERRSGQDQETKSFASDELLAYCNLIDMLEEAWPRSGSEDATGDEPTPVSIGRFTIVSELGHGGYGVVYLAHDPQLNRLVAIKLPRVDAMLARGMRNRFLREARAVAALDHPNVLPVFETGEIGGLCYLVMPYCEGGNLAEYLSGLERPLPIRRAATLALQLAIAVAYAHHRGVLHRDIKPANVMLEPVRVVTAPPASDAGLAEADAADSMTPPLASEGDFVPRLADFGLARIIAVDPGGEGSSAAGDATATGVILGTPRYMAPEQVETSPGSVGPASDIYSLGVLLYELLTGETPFTGASRLEILRRVLAEPPLPPRRLRSGVPADLEAICLKCLEKSPTRRYESADALAADLRRFLAGMPTRARPLNAPQRLIRWTRNRPAAASALALAMLAAAGVMLGLSIHYTRLNRYAAELADSLARESAYSQAADSQRQLAERREAEANRQAYISDIWRGWHLVENGQGHRVCELLNRSRPEPGRRDLRGFEWHYLWSLACNLSDLRGHTGTVYGAAFADDAQTMVSWGGDENDRTLRMWSVPQRRQLWEVSLAASPLQGRFIKDGRTIVIMDAAGVVTEFAADNGRVLRSQPYPHSGLAKFERYVHFSPDGGRVAYLSLRPIERGSDGQLVQADHSIHLWNRQTDEVRSVVDTGRDPIFATAATDDLRKLAFSSRRSGRYQIEVLDLAGGESQVIQTPGGVPCADIAFIRDGAALLIGNDGVRGGVRLWDLAGREERSFDAVPFDTELSVAASSDGRLVAAGIAVEPRLATPTRLRVFGGDGELLAEPEVSGERVQMLSFTPDGRSLLYCGSSGLLRLWNRARREPFEEVGRHEGEAWDVAYSPGGELLATSGDDAAIRLWDLASGRERSTLWGHTSLVTAVAFSPDARTLASVCYDGTLRLWDVATGEMTHERQAHQGPVRSVAFQSDGSRFVTAGSDAKVRLWRAADAQLEGVLDGHDARISTAAFVPNTSLLLSGDNLGCVNVWNAQSRERVGGWTDSSEVHSLAVSAAGDLLAVGGKSGLIRLYASPEMTLIRTIQGVPLGTKALSFSPDGLTLASGGEDAAVTLWNVASGQELLVMPGVRSWVHALAFSPDGHTLTAATHDGSIVQWRAPSPESF